jgi:DNA-directed RNA polymerase specialized sigma subunit
VNNPLLDLLKETTRLMNQERQTIAQLAKIRSDALKEARQTMTDAEIATHLGISRQQVHRLRTRPQ